jgi:hypothetical protein
MLASCLETTRSSSWHLIWKNVRLELPREVTAVRR